MHHCVLSQKKCITVAACMHDKLHEVACTCACMHANLHVRPKAMVKDGELCCKTKTVQVCVRAYARPWPCTSPSSNNTSRHDTGHAHVKAWSPGGSVQNQARRERWAGMADASSVRAMTCGLSSVACHACEATTIKITLACKCICTQHKTRSTCTTTAVHTS